MGNCKRAGGNGVAWVVAVVWVLAGWGWGAEQQPQQEKFDPRRWEKTIEAFEQKDQSNPSPKGGVLFVGSSSIRLWKVGECFPGRPVINRGFGGSHIADSLYYAERIVLPYRPATIIFYAGENDIAGGKSPEQVAGDFAAFVEKVRKALPKTRIVFIGLKPSPLRWDKIEQFRDTNGRIRKYIGGQKNMVFVDVEKVILGEDGQPRGDLFVADRLHLSAKGYELWTELLRGEVGRER